MNFGYIDDYLIVVYIFPHETDTEPTKNYRETYGINQYRLFYIKEGTARVQNGSNTYTMTENQLIINDAHNVFGYKFKSETDFKCLYIQMHPAIFKNIKDDKHFLRAFENLKPDESIIDCNQKDTAFLKQIIESIIECNFLHLGEAHILPRINTLVSQLCIYYDKKYATENVATDSVSVRIIDYIHRNYLSDITYQLITDKFFVSKPVINEILHKFTGKTLREYIEYLRLKDAETMLGNNIELHKIAELSGFNCYSTFFRAFKRVNGYSPSVKHAEHIKNWPLSK